jgi:hypothetical protein
MNYIYPRLITIIAVCLAISGTVFPLLMVLRIIAPSFSIGFFSYGATVASLFLGLISMASNDVQLKY